MEVSNKNLKRFINSVNKLNDAILACKKENPKCFAFLDAGGTLCLLDGSCGIGEDGTHDSIIAEGTINASGGDW